MTSWAPTAPLKRASGAGLVVNAAATAAPIVGSIDCAAVSAWRYSRDFFAAMRSDLDDPMTSILATGALASAPLDAVLVGGILLTNAALSSQQ